MKERNFKSWHPWHWILEDLTLTAYQKLVALILLKHANERGVAWPTVARIAKMAGISERTAQRALRQLQAKRIAALVGCAGNTHRISIWKIDELQPSMFTSKTVLDRKKQSGGLNPAPQSLKVKSESGTTVTITPGNPAPQNPAPQSPPQGKTIGVNKMHATRGVKKPCEEDHQDFEEVKASLNSGNHQDQMLRGVGDRLDDFRNNVLSRCEDSDGILATALDIIVDRIRQSGVNVNSPKYLEVALANFDFQQGEDREQLMQRLRRRRN